MRRLVVLALLVPLVLSACAGDPEPKFADPTPSALTTSTEPVTSAPVEPTTVVTSEPPTLSPEETVRAWVAGRNKLLKTGDPAVVESLSSGDCSTCTDLTAGIADIVAAGGYFKTRGWLLNGAKRDPDYPTSRIVHSAIVFAAGVTLPAPGKEPVRYAEERHFIDFTLVKDGPAWLVSRLVFVS